MNPIHPAVSAKNIKSRPCQWQSVESAMKEQIQAVRIEPRWPGALAVLIVLFMLAALPERVRMFPGHTSYIIGVAVLVPMVAVGLTAGSARWLRVERVIMLLFFVTVGAGTLANLSKLIGAMLHRSAEITGVQLLASSIAIWVTNILAFSLLYWQIDRGGPEARLKARGGEAALAVSAGRGPGVRAARLVADVR